MQDRDYQWFKDNYDDLFHQYGVTYLAIKDQKVLGTYPTYAEGVKRTAVSEPMGTFIVQYCNGEPSGYTNFLSSADFV